MRIVIDTDKVEKSGMKMDEVAYLTSLYFKLPIKKDLIFDLTKKGVATYHHLEDGIPIDITLTKEGTRVIESIFLDSEYNDTVVVDRYMVLADKLRALFPPGRKPGTNLQWKDSTVMVSNRLKALVKNYGIEFTDDEAVDATKRYVDSFRGDYRYMQTLKYFLFKFNSNNGIREESSQFLSYLENKDQDTYVEPTWEDLV